MKKVLSALALLLSAAKVLGQAAAPGFVTSDIDNFWRAFDQITTTTDSIQQADYLNCLFIAPGSPGLKALMAVRDYTPRTYLAAINHYPRFWRSIRQNTLKAPVFAQEIAAEVGKLKQLYPPLKSAPVYFTIGALRTGGTTQHGIVLIGSEIALTDQHTVTDEFPEPIRANRQRYFASNPINDVVLLNVHEVVHAQQKPIIHNLLSEALYEGVAEFVSVTATGRPSSTPAVGFGKANEARVKARFEQEMFNVTKSNQWLWSDAPNDFNVRDLGYYIGYALCERYYEQAPDKQAAIKEMIELDYANENQIEKFVDGTHYFSRPLSALYQSFERQQPRITGVKEFRNGSQCVSPGLTRLTLKFTTKMDPQARGFELGPLGEAALLRIKNFVSFAEDGKSATFEVELQPNQRYQVQPSFRFRSATGLPIKYYLIDFKTAAK